jgi:hypothetical protein
MTDHRFGVEGACDEHIHCPRIRVQDRHRTDDSQLVVVDAEWRKLGLCVTRCHTELLESSADHAVRAVAAIERWVERDRISRCNVADFFADAYHDSRSFMSGHDREHGRREFAVQYMHIGPADADGLHPDYCVTRTGHRLGHLSQRELTRSREDDGAHYRLLLVGRGNVTGTPCRR